MQKNIIAIDVIILCQFLKKIVFLIIFLKLNHLITVIVIIALVNFLHLWPFV